MRRIAAEVRDGLAHFEDDALTVGLLPEHVRRLSQTLDQLQGRFFADTAPRAPSKRR